MRSSCGHRGDLQPTAPTSGGLDVLRAVGLRLAANPRTRSGAVQIADALLSQHLRHRVHFTAPSRMLATAPADELNVWIAGDADEVAATCAGGGQPNGD